MEVDTVLHFLSPQKLATRQAVFLNQALHPADLVLKAYADQLMNVPYEGEGYTKHENKISQSETETGVSCSRIKWSQSPWQKLAKLPPT